jgi:hypothetical protein
MNETRTKALVITVLAILFFSAIFIVQCKAETGVNQTPDSWTSKSHLPIAAGSFRAAAVNGEIYCIGGSSTYQYDPSRDTWTTRTPMPTPCTDFGVAVCNGKIYCIGGTTGFTAETGYPAISNNQVYDPVTDTWENRTDMPTPRAFLQANVVGDQIFLIGGKLPDIVQDFTVPHIPHYGNQVSNAVEVYNSTSNEWASKTAIPIAVAFYVSAVFNNKIYIVSNNANQVYDIQSDSWSQAALPISSDIGSGGQTTGEFAPLRQYVFGENTTQSYNPVADSWTLCSNLPTSRFDTAVAQVNDIFYVIGGYVKSTPNWPSLNQYYIQASSANEQYAPIGYGTPDQTVTKPEITILSPQNLTYNASSIPLNFTVDKQTTSLWYSLDSKENATVLGNTTLTNVPEGQHDLVVWANDTYGNLASSQTITFRIKTPTIDTVQAITIAGVATCTTVAVGTGYLIKIKKVK